MPRKLNESTTTADFGPLIPYRSGKFTCDYCGRNASGIIIPSGSGLQYIPLSGMDNDLLGFYICDNCLQRTAGFLKITREV